MKGKMVSVSPVHKSVPQAWYSKESWFTQSTDQKKLASCSITRLAIHKLHQACKYTIIDFKTTVDTPLQ